ncbi:putative transporter MCH1 [Glarea lozoyensis 74030]|uniref:Probable transporter MCH1 n=1 Tax=Glarea lozoyensis (strain ATCC 74030 / MF5533) TaxID=1104152 RepID=H0EKS7_GLAL7|nr:putative transporter MCH1 [Glarea lozoyensis 74030]
MGHTIARGWPLGRSYGTLGELSDDELEETRRQQDIKSREEEEARKKTWLLNEETSRFLKDKTMWFLAAGFFFVSGPARIAFGTLTDVFAPATTGHPNQSLSNSLSSLPPRDTHKPFSISRVAFLILTALLLSLGQVILASGLIQNHGERFWIVSTLIGTGYGAIFSLTPLIITVIWGVENFGTNWGIVAMVPAFGASVWGIVYSTVYQWGAKMNEGVEGMEEDVLCHGKRCYEGSFWAMAFLPVTMRYPAEIKTCIYIRSNQMKDKTTISMSPAIGNPH